MLNVLSNAVKFQIRGEIRVTALIKEDLAKNMLLEVSVTDSGNGMSQEVALQAFDLVAPESHATHAPQQRGKVGLYISKRICKSLGGNIAVHSELEQGTTFTFTVKVFKVRSHLANRSRFIK